MNLVVCISVGRKIALRAVLHVALGSYALPVLASAATTPADAAKVVYSLPACFPVAQYARPVTHLNFSRDPQWLHYPVGWDRARINANGGGACWTTRGPGTFAIPIVAPHEVEIVLPLAGLDVKTYRNLPLQTVECLWNGTSLGVFPLDAEKPIAVANVPASLQRIGLNLLEIAPNYWIGAGYPDNPYRGVLSRGVLIRQGPPEREAAGDIAALDGDAIVQQAGSVLSFYFWLPAQARLRGSLTVSPGAPPNDVTISVLGSTNQEHKLFRRVGAELAEESPLEIDLDLSALAGQAAAINFAVTLEDSAPEGASALQFVRWESFRLEGTHPAVPDVRPPAPEKSCNILIVLFDALRADFTAPYGSQSVATPHMTRLSERGVTFENAFANSHWTRASVASVMTGLYPGTHACVEKSSKLAAALPFLPELLQRAGYRTAGFVNNINVGAVYGFNRGFDEFAEFHQRTDPVRRAAYRAARSEGPNALADYVWSTYLEPVVGAQSDAPFFVYLHEIDPHDPYDPPAPYDASALALRPLENFAVFGGEAALGEPGAVTGLLAPLVNSGRLTLLPPDLAFLEALYKGEIEYMDKCLGRLLDRLEETGVLEDTLVVFLSDHGEEFLEHGSLSHGQSVYDELLRVPLLLALPGTFDGARRIGADVQLIDLMPTILEMAGVQDGPVLQGSSLLPLLQEANHPDTPRATFATRAFKDRKQLTDSVRYGDWKLHSWSEHGQYYLELFDTGKDPAEQRDVWRQHPVIGLTLYQLLRQQRRVNGQLELATPPEELPESSLDEDTIENLKALGYLH